jgi:hypothetical protein
MPPIVEDAMARSKYVSAQKPAQLYCDDGKKAYGTKHGYGKANGILLLKTAV